MKKCFEGINSLEFVEETLDITKMVSGEGEEIVLKRNVNTANAKGSVEKWLLELEKGMIASLRKVGSRVLLQTLGGLCVHVACEHVVVVVVCVYVVVVFCVYVYVCVYVVVCDYVVVCVYVVVVTCVLLLFMLMLLLLVFMLLSFVLVREC